MLGIYTSNRNSEDTLANAPNNLGVDSRVDHDIATATDDDATTIGKEGASATPLGVDSRMDQDIATVKDNNATTIRKEGAGATPLAMPPENQDGTMGVETDREEEEEEGGERTEEECHDIQERCDIIGKLAS